MIDSIIWTIAFVVAIGIWAAFGFQFFPDPAGFGALVIVAIAFYWWMVRHKDD